MRAPAKTGTASRRDARVALDAARRGRAHPGPPRSSPRLRHPDADLQQRGHPQSPRRHRRRRPLRHFAHLCAVDRLRAGRHRRRAIERHEERHAGRSAPATRSPPSTFPRISSATFSPGSGRRSCRSTTGNISRPATTRPRRSRAPSRRRPLRCRTRRSGGYKPGVLVAEQYVLSNPALNFAQFLLRAVLPTVLHVVVAIAGGYAVGSEFSRRSKRAWMRAAGGRPLVALIGKFLPLFAIFIIMMVVDAAIIHVLYGVTFRGDPLLVAASACLLLIGYLSFGALLVLLTQALPTGLSLIALILQSGVRLCRRGLPGRRDGRFPAGLGLDPAPSLVSPDPVRPGGARPAAVGFRQALPDPRRPRLPLFRARLGEAARHRRCAAETRGGARASACDTGAASPSRWATRPSAFSATAGSSA